MLGHCIKIYNLSIRSKPGHPHLTVKLTVKKKPFLPQIYLKNKMDPGHQIECFLILSKSSQPWKAWNCIGGNRLDNLICFDPAPRTCYCYNRDNGPPLTWNLCSGLQRSNFMLFQTTEWVHPGLLQCTRNFWTRLHFVHIWNWFPLVFLFSHLFCNLRQNLNEHLAASLGWVCSRLTIPADHTQLMSIRCPAQRNVTQKHPTVQTTAVQCDSEASSYWTNNTLCAAPEFGRSS